jgi:hypothetical protein
MDDRHGFGEWGHATRRTARRATQGASGVRPLTVMGRHLQRASASILGRSRQVGVHALRADVRKDGRTLGYLSPSRELARHP